MEVNNYKWIIGRLFKNHQTGAWATGKECSKSTAAIGFDRLMSFRARPVAQTAPRFSHGNFGREIDSSRGRFARDTLARASSPLCIITGWQSADGTKRPSRRWPPAKSVTLPHDPKVCNRRLINFVTPLFLGSVQLPRNIFLVKWEDD